MPVLAPNGERPLFDDLREFRFVDGGRFVWQGHNWQSYLDRGGKGFAPTFFVGRTFGGLAGKYRIDWFLVKTCHAASVAAGEEFQLAPFWAHIS